MLTTPGTPEVVFCRLLTVLDSFFFFDILKYMKHYQKNNGFTLIELLVVVLIIGILSSIALPQYQKAVLKTRFTSMMAVVDGIAQAQELYYLENGKYATSFDELAVSLPCAGVTGIFAMCGGIHYATTGYAQNYSAALEYKRLFQNNPEGTKRYCIALLNRENGEMARKVCKSIGTLDSEKTSSSFEYYLL